TAPMGGIAFGGEDRPVFLACGIGITPALAVAFAAPTRPGRVYWWVRSTEAPGLIDHVRERLAQSALDLVLIDTSKDGARLGEDCADWLRARLMRAHDLPHVCGPVGFQSKIERALDALEWPRERLKLSSFVYGAGIEPDEPRAPLERVEQFRVPDDTVVTESFHLREARSFVEKQREARAFLAQFYHEIGAPEPFQDRLLAVTRALRRTGSYRHTPEELAFGARLAWRNSNRCIGRYFWQSLVVRDRREPLEGLEGRALAKAVFDELVAHMTFGTNGGDLRPSITVFPSEKDVFIENGQLILYAGYPQKDGTILGDPKNVELTKKAISLGWYGNKTEFDVLPIMITISGQETHLFKLPETAILEVALSHPEQETFAKLGLKWFALPAVANMALDLGGVVYRAAPSNGFYMGTEIGSFNLADPKRYDKLVPAAEALGIDRSESNPMWRDQALTEINRAVLHSFRAQGVRILDHHSLSSWFDRFRADEAAKGRPVFGHWPWIVPPMAGNLSNVWHDAKLKNVILKPGYFYQQSPTAEAKESTAA
ncbi:MAG: nitric oxide synthase oxygenase, partial [Pseudomonadota bacterium]